MFLWDRFRSDNGQGSRIAQPISYFSRVYVIELGFIYLDLLENKTETHIQFGYGQGRAAHKKKSSFLPVSIFFATLAVKYWFDL